MENTLPYASATPDRKPDTRAKLTFILGIGGHPFVVAMLFLLLFVATYLGDASPNVMGYLILTWAIFGAILCPVITVACGSAVLHRDADASTASHRLAGLGILSSLIWPAVVALTVLILPNFLL